MKVLPSRTARAASLALLTLLFLLIPSALLAQEPASRARRVVRERKVSPPKAKPKVVSLVEVKEAKEKLAALGYWLANTDESYRHALTAFQKVQARQPTGKLSCEDLEVLRIARTPVPKEVQTLEAGKIRVEVDLRRQVLFIIDHENNVTKILPVSSGNDKEFTSEGFARDAVTPPGRFHVYNKIKGWKKSPLGLLYYPNYYLSGLAIHGSTFVPAYPDSHGCVRVPMYAAEALFELLTMGTEILIHSPLEAKE